MKLANLALVSTMALLGLVAVGCAARGRRHDDDGILGTDESQLVEDDSEAAGRGRRDGVRRRRAAQRRRRRRDPGHARRRRDDAEVLEQGEDEPRQVVQARRLHHRRRSRATSRRTSSTDCTGPYGLASFNGTVTSTYVREPATLTVTHEATGFKANGASITGKRVVVYTQERLGDHEAPHRRWTGTTKNGKPISHTADFTTT